jgi:hypothetical protein
MSRQPWPTLISRARPIPLGTHQPESPPQPTPATARAGREPPRKRSSLLPLRPARVSHPLGQRAGLTVEGGDAGSATMIWPTRARSTTLGAGRPPPLPSQEEPGPCPICGIQPNHGFNTPKDQPDPVPNGHDDQTHEITLRDPSGRLRLPAYILIALVIAAAAVLLVTARAAAGARVALRGAGGCPVLLSPEAPRFGSCRPLGAVAAARGPDSYPPDTHGVRSRPEGGEDDEVGAVVPAVGSNAPPQVTSRSAGVRVG